MIIMKYVAFQDSTHLVCTRLAQSWLKMLILFCLQIVNRKTKIKEELCTEGEVGHTYIFISILLAVIKKNLRIF